MFWVMALHPLQSLVECPTPHACRGAAAPSSDQWSADKSLLDSNKSIRSQSLWPHTCCIAWVSTHAPARCTAAPSVVSSASVETARGGFGSRWLSYAIAANLLHCTLTPAINACSDIYAGDEEGVICWMHLFTPVAGRHSAAQALLCDSCPCLPESPGSRCLGRGADCMHACAQAPNSPQG